MEKVLDVLAYQLILENKGKKHTGGVEGIFVSGGMACWIFFSGIHIFIV